ncbi:TadE/TadG family type IV pilus assembly protein [Methylobacter svalbardensis]|uniref:TadE/TadG family type IV pilus assembly protein n=1 Tax=Methylobacter svalbardensis TaxID=3080016 RepID=UPI0030EB1CE8
MKTQRGAAMVEFVLIALLFFIILFGIIEFARAFFTYNTLVEATRRGARVAAVCPVSSAGITQVKQVTIFDTPGGSSTPLLGLTEDNIRVKYFNSGMTDPADLAASDSSPITSIFGVEGAKYNNIAFVRVEILPTFTHTLIIPTFMSTFPVPPIVTTLPSESLGRVSSENPITQRCCYGVCTTT